MALTETVDRPYTTVADHLADELQWLDCLIRSRIPAARRPSDNALAGFRGLVMSSPEIDDILEHDPGQAERPDPRWSEQATRLREQIDSRLARTAASGVLLSLPYLAEVFRLTRTEEHILVLGLASETHRRYDRLFAYLHDDVTRKQPSMELAQDLLCSSSADRAALRTLFDSASPLLRYRLLRFPQEVSSQPLRMQSFSLDPRIAGQLMGSRATDPKISSHSTIIQPLSSAGAATDPVTADSTVTAQLRREVRAYFGPSGDERPNIVLHIRGPYGSGRRALALNAADELGLPAITVDASRLERTGEPTAEVLWHAARESLLSPAILVVEDVDALLERATAAQRALSTLWQSITWFCRFAVLVGEQQLAPPEAAGSPMLVTIDSTARERRSVADVWAAQCQRIRASVDAEALQSLVGRFNFTPGRVADAMNGAYATAIWRSPEQPRVTEADVRSACRRMSGTALNGLARRIRPRYDWADIVLPEDAYRQVRSIAERVRNQQVVMDRWGFGRKLSLGKGVSALFAGPPGTGKTMAAEVVANDLGLELYKIDLSQVVSKYIGETEKNLDRVFSAAEEGSAILFFDEADALFGKRSDVKDSHDRYANVEISYLLQKMEEYEGVAVLATNLRRHLDDAFMRRLQHVIEFPFPGRSDRESIWRVMFPPELPLHDDVDITVLARDIRLSGAGIRNVSLSAAHLAAADGGAVTMAHLWEASEREYEKLGRSLSAPVSVEAVS